jgi:hypothetical protein
VHAGAPAMHIRSGKKNGKGSVESQKAMGCGSGSLPKKAKTASRTKLDCNPELQEGVTVKEEELDEEQEFEEEEEEMCNVFTLEMDNLECGMCFQPFESQVYSVSTQTLPTFRHRI